MIRAYLNFEADEEVSAALNKLLENEHRKFLSSVSYVKYPVGRNSGLIQHRDSESIFTCVIIIKDTNYGRLHFVDKNLPKRFKPEDLIFIDPFTEHDVPYCARDEDRKVVVFNV